MKKTILVECTLQRDTTLFWREERYINKVEDYTNNYDDDDDTYEGYLPAIIFQYSMDSSSRSNKS